MGVSEGHPQLVLLVGPASRARQAIGRALVERGLAVVVCHGPPGCSLLLRGRCALVEIADTVVITRRTAAHPGVTVPLTWCAHRARGVILVGHDAVDPHPVGSLVLDSGTPPAGVADAVEGAYGVSGPATG